MARHPKPDSPFRWFDTSPEVIQMVVLLSVRLPLVLRNVDDLAFERDIDICHETLRLWVNRFGPMFASKIRSRRVQAMRQNPHWRWHLNEAFVRVNGERR
jgi:putative transposase